MVPEQVPGGSESAGCLFYFYHRFTVTFTVENRQLAGFCDFADFGLQDGVLEPGFDCKKVSRVVSEHVPGGSESVECLFYL